jgi:hypothetical protein
LPTAITPRFSVGAAEKPRPDHSFRGRIAASRIATTWIGAQRVADRRDRQQAETEAAEPETLAVACDDATAAAARSHGLSSRQREEWKEH